MLNLFKKTRSKEVMRISQHLNKAFSKVEEDISNVRGWVDHLHQKNSYLERSHSSHVDVTKKELESMNRWVFLLNQHNIELQKYLKELTGYLVSLQNKDSELTERIHRLERSLEDHSRKGSERDAILEEVREHAKNAAKALEATEKMKNDLSLGQDRTPQGTSQGQVKDISLEENNVSPTGKPEILPVSRVKINKSSLTGSQIELLDVLYGSDRPLSYNELARILNKKSKSVRNLIYELRDKGIGVESRFVGLRKKGFFLDNESKIVLSGR
jgi:chromosome segregation ATPase